jgi:urea transport system permease protein
VLGQILDIVTSAAILYVIATGLLIVFGVMKIINFAHGAFLTIGAYAALVVSNAGLNPWLFLPVAFVTGVICGMAVEFLVVRRLYKRPLDAILATWGLSIVINELINIGFGRQVQFVRSPISGAMSFLGETYSKYRLVLVTVAILVGFGLAAIIRTKRIGLTARAVIMNEDLAQGLGINSSLVRFMAFSLGAGLASLAGALITPLSSVDPSMGVPWLISAFMLVLVSGTSLTSLAVAALVLGGAQVLVSAYISPVVGGLTIVVLAAALLRVRPQGFSRA